MSVVTDLSSSIRQPEYTGENRCMPCTIVNAIITVILAAIVAVFWIPAGIGVLLIGAGAIYFRGYLIPWTPELTQRYLPERVLRAFGKHEVDGAVGDTQLADGTDSPELEDLLLGSGVVEECDEVDDLCLTPAFEDAWWDRIRTLRGDDEHSKQALASVIDVRHEDLEFIDEDAFAVTFEGQSIARWESKAMFLADLAVRPLLEDTIAQWPHLGQRERTGLIAGLRAFLEQCPNCESDLEQVEDVRKSCCGNSLTKVEVSCDACGVVVFSGSYR